MRRRRHQVRPGWALSALTVAAGLAPHSASACATCFGRSDSAMAQGMNMGILTLLFVITSVLFAIAAFFFYLLRRAARLTSQRPEAGPEDVMSDAAQLSFQLTSHGSAKPDSPSTP